MKKDPAFDQFSIVGSFCPYCIGVVFGYCNWTMNPSVKPRRGRDPIDGLNTLLGAGDGNPRLLLHLLISDSASETRSEGW